MNKIKVVFYHCIELNKTYPSARAAEKDTGIDSSTILKTCKGIRKTAGKHPVTKEPLHWKFIDLTEEVHEWLKRDASALTKTL